MKLQRNRRVLVDLEAVAANFRLLAARVQPAVCGAVVKTDAYGLGADRVGRALLDAGCRHFFVATVDEGLALRTVVDDAEIYLLEGPVEGVCDTMRLQRLWPVLNSAADARLWSHAADRNAHAIVHIDTGMNRLGMDAGDITELIDDPAVLASFSVDYVMTQLACADEPDRDHNALQLARFDALRAQLPGVATSIANSPGVFAGKAFHGDLVRAGIALYGGNPQPGSANPMREVARVEGRVLQLRTLSSADSVGYGASARVGAGSRLATVAYGYGDGYPRSLGNAGSARVGSRTVPVIGRISMDYLTLDVTAVPEDEIAVGDWVTLIGGGLDLDAVAATAGTIGYELLTAIGSRVERIYLRRETRKR